MYQKETGNADGFPEQKNILFFIRILCFPIHAATYSMCPELHFVPLWEKIFFRTSGSLCTQSIDVSVHMKFRCQGQTQAKETLPLTTLVAPTCVTIEIWCEAKPLSKAFLSYSLPNSSTVCKFHVFLIFYYFSENFMQCNLIIFSSPPTPPRLPFLYSPNFVFTYAPDR